MKVMITGCTSQQSSAKAAKRTPTFASLLSEMLVGIDVDVEIKDPSIYTSLEELAQYDIVLVGIAPLTSLSANKLIPAFSVASKAQKAGNLNLFIDAPDQYKLQSSLKSCHLNMTDLQKPFYNKRRNYSDLISDSNLQKEVYSFIDYLYLEQWPKTLFPAFPWSKSTKAISKSLPNADESSLIPVVVDMKLLKAPFVSQDFSMEMEYWTCDSPKTEWSKSISKSLKYQVQPTRSSAWESEAETSMKIKKSIGTLVSVYRGNEPWWSPALAQSLSLGKPVATDWRQTSYLGSDWSHLASSIEEMGDSERFDLAGFQKETYLKTLPTSEDVAESLLHTLTANTVAS
jgi:hypothetical protein